MEVISGELEQRPGRPHAVAIGVFDGVHIGHQALIELAKQRATELDVATAVVTFDPHPARLVRPDHAPLMLTSLEYRLELLAELGVDTAVVVRFDEARAKEAPRDFIQTVLIDGLAVRAVVVGTDFRFGKDRVGDVQLLAEVGRQEGSGVGFGVDELDLVRWPESLSSAIPSSSARAGHPETVSSTTIRRLLAQGDVVTAAELLGRPHEDRGVVMEGDQRGRQIGFPTANVAVERYLARPADGVYAGWYLRPDGSRHAAAINVGKRPTFYQDAPYSLTEAHLVEFTGDLYGERARVQFVEYLRAEKRFDGIDALAEQLEHDVAQARSILQGGDGPTAR